MSPPLPPDEEERLKTLRRYEILDTEAERVFDDITLLASHICGTPIALITLVDEHRQWFKSRIGIEETETPRDISFCAHALSHHGLLVINDALKDERFATSPLVTDGPRIRFYAGAPLRTSDGHVLGVLCVADRVPRDLSAPQRSALEALSRQVIAELELRRAMAGLRRTEESLRLLNSAVLQSRESILITGAALAFPGPAIIFVNPAFTRMTGYSAEEAIGKTPRILQGPRTDKAVLLRLRQCLERGEVFEGEAINYRKDGTEFAMEWQIAPIRDAGGIITHFVAIQHDITERRRNEETLRESKRFAESIAENSTSIIYLYDMDTRRPVYANRDAAATLGYSPAQIIEMGENFLSIAVHPEDLPRIRALHAHYAEVVDNRIFDIEYRMKDAGGEWHWMWTRETVFKRHPNGAAWQILGTAQDITERKRLESRVFQSQKMETVGKLAGGIAHEFNSILTAIIGQSQLLLGDLPPGGPLAKSATEITVAANRAAKLTQQLLAYGRKQILQPETLDLNQIVAGMEGMFRHLMGGNVEMELILAPDLQAVKADAGQIEQVIMNIAINAHDAMPNGGRLTLETSNVSMEQESVGRASELKPGEYVMLAITDSGMGMSPEVKSRVFEPFFSTKGVGQGSGLGLSTCHGIVKQSGGYIGVYTEPGLGATFNIYLPQVQREAAAIPGIQHLDSPDLPRGSETILLVEDDPALREMAAVLLRRLGYAVFPAANGIEALSLKNRRDIGHVDLLFTDVAMPHMSGRELSERVQASYPYTKILFTSAYAENAVVHNGVLDPGVALLQKPFTPSALAHKLREVLDRPASPALRPDRSSSPAPPPPPPPAQTPCIHENITG